MQVREIGILLPTVRKIDLFYIERCAGHQLGDLHSEADGDVFNVTIGT